MPVAYGGREPAGRADRLPPREQTEGRARVLVVEPDPTVRAEIESLLRGEGFATSTVPDSATALAEARRALPAVVLTDLQAPGVRGGQLCQQLHAIDPDLPVIVMTGQSDVQSVIESFRSGAEDCLMKPLKRDALRGRVDRAIARRSAKAETEGLYRTLNQRLVLSSVRELAHAEAEAQQRAQLAALLENLSEGVVIADPGGRVVMINGAARVVLGLGTEEVLTVDALHVSEAYDLEGRALGNEQRPVMRALRGERFTEYEMLRAGPNGERRHLVSTGTCVEDQSHRVALAIVVFRDVTDLRRLERQRHELEATTTHMAVCLASAIESVQDAFAVFDDDDRLFLCNGEYRALVGIAGSPVGKSYAEVIESWMGGIAFPDEAARARFREEQLARRRAEHTTTFDVRMLDGRRLRVTGRRTAAGGFVKTIFDLTDEEQRAEELRAARGAAEAGSAAKSEFLSSMSHELRTPLNAILGFAQLLRRDKRDSLSERHQERVDQILKGGEHLLRLIDDILDLSRIEARGVSISTEPVSVVEVLDELRWTLESTANRQNVSVAFEPPPDLPEVVADRTRFLQILMNFGTNAIKYNRPNGTVTFAVSRPNPERVRVTVRDTGPGIAVDKQDRLFQPFQRAGQETGPIEGTGIGLVVTKRLAELMGGEVGFRSVEGQGSDFWVDLPSA